MTREELIESILEAVRSRDQIRKGLRGRVTAKTYHNKAYDNTTRMRWDRETSQYEKKHGTPIRKENFKRLRKAGELKGRREIKKWSARYYTDPF